MVGIKYTTILVWVANTGLKIASFIHAHGMTPGKGALAGISPAGPSLDPLEDPLIFFI
jgi:hypothetical protein